MKLLDVPEDEAEGDGIMAQNAAMDVEKIVVLAKTAQQFDEESLITDVDEAKTRHIPSVPDLEDIVASMAELKSGLNTICKKQEMPYPAAFATNVAELKASH